MTPRRRRPRSTRTTTSLLDTIGRLVKGEAHDAELTRLLRARDADGALDHLRRRFDELTGVGTR